MAVAKTDSGRQTSPPRQHSGLRGRVYSLTFTLPKLIFLVLFGVLGVTWVFIFGIMLGRGHKPEKNVPELARLMPSAFSHNATLAPPPPADVLRPDELRYQESLKGHAVAAALPKAPEAPGGKSSAKDAAAKTRRPSGREQTENAPAKEKAKVPAPAASARQDRGAAHAGKEPEAAAAERYDYVYQVAAFKSGPPAEALRGKLLASGLKPAIEKETEGAATWYRILVSFRGKPEETRGMREILAKNGISRILLRSKKSLK